MTSVNNSAIKNVLFALNARIYLRQYSTKEKHLKLQQYLSGYNSKGQQFKCHKTGYSAYTA